MTTTKKDKKKQSFLLLIWDNKIHHVVLTHINKYIAHILMHFIHLRIHISIIDKKKKGIQIDKYTDHSYLCNFNGSPVGRHFFVDFCICFSSDLIFCHFCKIDPKGVFFIVEKLE